MLLFRSLLPSGKFLPTLTHYFYFLLQKHGLLQRVFTQNIDTCVSSSSAVDRAARAHGRLTFPPSLARLERVAGVRDSLVVEAHGSFASARCIVCRTEASQAWVKEQIEAGAIPLCPVPGCKGRSGAFVKPEIVFFGESLPEKFFAHLGDLASCDLLLVFGTSLKVQVRRPLAPLHLALAERLH